MTAFAQAGHVANDPAEGPRLKAAYKKAHAVMKQQVERVPLGLGVTETHMPLPIAQHASTASIFHQRPTYAASVIA